MISPAPRKPTPAATPVMGTVEPHRQAAQHRQSHAQQSLQIGHGGEPAPQPCPDLSRADPSRIEHQLTR
jgi:hypothetical protein